MSGSESLFEGSLVAPDPPGDARELIGEGDGSHVVAASALDATHASAPGWLAAQAADARFISSYAQDFPVREDVAESFLPYVAVRYRSDRISQSLADTLLAAMANRIDYLDAQSFDMHPIE